jgi:hypothetical protein
MVGQHRNYSRQIRWTILLAAVLAAVQVTAVFQALGAPATSVTTSIPQGVQALVSGLWAAAFLAGVYALAARRPQAFKRVLWLLFGFLFYSVMRLVLFTRADYDRQRLALLVAVSILGLIALASTYLSQRIRSQIDGAQQNDGESSLWQ